MHTGIQNAGTHQKILKLLKSQLQHYLFFPDVFYQSLRWMGNLEPETYKTSGSSLQQVGFWRRGRFQSRDPHRNAMGTQPELQLQPESLKFSKVWSWFPPIIPVLYFERRYHGRAAPRSRCLIEIFLGEIFGPQVWKEGKIMEIYLIN